MNNDLKNDMKENGLELRFYSSYRRDIFMDDASIVDYSSCKAHCFSVRIGLFLTDSGNFFFFLIAV